MSVYNTAVIQEETVSVSAQLSLPMLRSATGEESTFAGDRKSFAVSMSAPLLRFQKHTKIQIQSILYKYCYSVQAESYLILPICQLKTTAFDWI